MPFLCFRAVIAISRGFVSTATRFLIALDVARAFARTVTLAADVWSATALSALNVQLLTILAHFVATAMKRDIEEE